MGTLYCLKCKQSAEGETFADADTLIDHAGSSKRCSGNPSYMQWNGEKLGVEPVKAQTKTTKKKKD